MIDEDVELQIDKRKEAIAILNRTPFDRLVIDKHYFNKYGNPRHGIPLTKAKEIYEMCDKILMVTYRNSNVGRKYCFIYRLNKNQSYKLMLFLDRNPPNLFNAMPSGRNIEKKLIRRFFRH